MREEGCVDFVSGGLSAPVATSIATDSGITTPTTSSPSPVRPQRRSRPSPQHKPLHRSKPPPPPPPPQPQHQLLGPPTAAHTAATGAKSTNTSWRSGHLGRAQGS